MISPKLLGLLGLSQSALEPFFMLSNVSIFVSANIEFGVLFFFLGPIS